MASQVGKFPFYSGPRVQPVATRKLT